MWYAYHEFGGVTHSMDDDRMQRWLERTRVNPSRSIFGPGNNGYAVDDNTVQVCGAESGQLVRVYQWKERSRA
jgi:hypothetical protein